MILYRHKITGKIYRHLAHGVDVSLSQFKGNIIFAPLDNDHSVFSCEDDAFFLDHEVIKEELHFCPIDGSRCIRILSASNNK